jgi:hypothetical protein
MQPVQPGPGLVLQLPRLHQHSLQLHGQIGVPAVAGPYMRGPQRHRRITQKTAGILKIGGVMQLNSCHTPYPYGVVAHSSTFRSAGRLPKDPMEDTDLPIGAHFVGILPVPITATVVLRRCGNGSFLQ